MWNLHTKGGFLPQNNEPTFKKMKLNKYSFVCYSGILLLIGYLAASCACNKEIWVDLNSGIIETRIKVFPFSKTFKSGDRAFQLLFPPLGDVVDPNWVLVSKESLVIPSVKNISNKGQAVVSAQRVLVLAFKEKNFSKIEREEIAKIFFEKMRIDTSEASEFAMDIWKSNASK